MSYYKSSKPDWITSPVGIAPRPFIAGGLREWPPRGYIGPTTNYRMPAMSGGCGACGGFGQEPGEAGSEAEPTLDWVIDPGDGTVDDAYKEYTSDVTQAGSGQPAPAPAPAPGQPGPELVKKGSLWVPVLLGLGLLGLIWFTRDKKKARRNAPPGNAARRRYMLRSRARSGRYSYRVRRNAAPGQVCGSCGGTGSSPFTGEICGRCWGSGKRRPRRLGSDPNKSWTIWEKRQRRRR